MNVELYVFYIRNNAPTTLLLEDAPLGCLDLVGHANFVRSSPGVYIRFITELFETVCFAADNS